MIRDGRRVLRIAYTKGNSWYLVLRLPTPSHSEIPNPIFDIFFEPNDGALGEHALIVLNPSSTHRPPNYGSPRRHCRPSERR